MSENQGIVANHLCYVGKAVAVDGVDGVHPPLDSVSSQSLTLVHLIGANSI